MIDGTAAAQAEVDKFVVLHKAGGETLSADQVDVRFGDWDSDSRQFTPSATNRTAIEVTVSSIGRPTFFGKVLGADSFDSKAKAVATFSPRDIMLVLDYSGSMCFDSQLRSINALGQGAVEASLFEIYQGLGSPTYGNMQWTPQYISSNKISTIKNSLGLTNVPYPYPSGSWNDYIQYVKGDTYISQAGYRKKYGYLTWVNYLQARKPMYSQTPDLWQGAEQPVTAVKDAVDLLAVYLDENSPDDRLGLVIYTYSDDKAFLESSMTHDFASIATITRHRQAGHYDQMTNIYDGMKAGRLEFQNNARAGARKMMVLMTDGQANLPYNSYYAKQKALEEATACAAAGIPIITISLGSGADTNLMQQIADITKGAYFEIPGGQTVAEYEEDLKDVFRKVAADRGLMLVQ